MATPTSLIVLSIVFSILLISVFVFRPAITANRGGKIMAFLVLLALPLLCLGFGGVAELEHSKSTNFLSLGEKHLISSGHSEPVQ